MQSVNLGRIRPIYRGEYDPGTPYNPLDFVGFGGVTYFCIQQAQGIAPTNTAYFQPVLDKSLLAVIDDTQTSADLAWSSQRIINSLQSMINDAVVATDSVWSSNKVDAELTSVVAAIPEAVSEYQEFTASGTFTKDPNATWVYVEAIGAGGGGSGNSSAAGGGGGGAGVRSLFRAADIGSSEIVTLGSGGSGSNGTTGSDGGDTTFGALLTAPGGRGAGFYGNVDYPSSKYGRGGSGIAQCYVRYDAMAGQGDGSSGSGGFGKGSPGGDTLIGGAGGGGFGDSIAYMGGTSRLGGNGGDARSTTGAPGEYPGGGGGASGSSTGGAGADGRVRIWQW